MYNAEKGAVEVGADKSMTHLSSLEMVPELVAWEADEATCTCKLLRFEMVILVAFVNVGLWIFTSFARSPRPSSSILLMASCWLFCSPGESLSSGVGAKEELALDVSDTYTGGYSLCDLASSAASVIEIAEAFLRVLNVNFLGGLNELRVSWSFSVRALTSWYY